MTPAALVGWFALLAAAATVIGAVTLGLFFSKGQPWGTINDVSSIFLMLATIPVAVGIADATSYRVSWSGGIAVVGIVGMLGASVSQTLLISRRLTYERLLPWTLGFGAIVGVWYLLIGLAGIRAPFFEEEPVTLDSLAIASGISFIALGYGFLRGNERHPLSIIGGIVLLVTSTWFLVRVGLLLVGSDIAAA